MRAAVVQTPGHLTCVDLPEPQIGEYDALCDLVYGATCSGTDSHIIAGRFPWNSPYPTVLGHESVGRVIEIGPKVRNLRIGDLVTRVGTPPAGEYSVTWGGFAERGVAVDHWAMCADGLPADQWQGKRVNQVVPSGVDERVAPMFTTWRETWSYITRLGVGPGMRVLVIGSGGNGLSFAAHAVNLGAEHVAVAGAARLEAATREKAGVHGYFDYRNEETPGQLRESVPAGFDLIIDAVGQAQNADRYLPTIAAGGSFAVYGIDDRGKLSLSPELAPSHFTFTMGKGYDEAEGHGAVSDFARQGKLDITLWYDPEKTYPLSAISDAFDAVKQRVSPKVLVDLKA